MKRAPRDEAGSRPADTLRITPSFRPQQVPQQAPCQAACPTCGDIRGWIGVVAQREKTGLSAEEAYLRAWRIITEVNPFPSVLGRICPHPCEAGCNRAEHDEALSINAMERFLGDWAIAKNLALEQPPPGAMLESIGVVGAGPSGLSFAYQMARRGYAVTVYESRPMAGGMLRYGVPDYRLPPGVLDSEIRRITDLGVTLELNTRVGSNLSLELLRSRHAAVYLGLGAASGRKLGIEGEEGPGVWTGIDYLSRVNSGEPISLGQRVAVVGGGNTAIDAARTARRRGSEVVLLYRRAQEDMPAERAEIAAALEEGVELQAHTLPVRLVRAASGSLLSVVACKVRAGAADESGRNRPVPVPGSEFALPADALITAVSQAPDLAGFEDLAQAEGWLIRDAPGFDEEGLLAGGDVLGLGIAGNAIVQGRKAAERLHAKLRGAGLPAEPDTCTPAIAAARIKFDQKPVSAATHSPLLPVAERFAQNSAEDAATISESQFLDEVARCYSCGSCFGCEQCAMFCTPGCFTKLESVGPGMYFTLMLDACEACGKCIEVCPCGFLEAS